jgi:serine protease inhibitor
VRCLPAAEGNQEKERGMLKKNLSGMFILIFLLLCLVVACGKSTNDTPPQYEIVQSSLIRDANPQTSDADLAAVVAGSSDFALKVFPLIDPSGSNNVVFSPYSITQAFALTAPGAKGSTLSGIEQAMSFLPQDRLNPALNKLDLLLTSEASGTVTATGDQYPILRNANALWGQKGFTILSEYLDTLAVNYGAGMHVVDFVNQTEDARNAINSWVEDRTNNRIQDLIPQGGVTPNTRVVLTNAVWFKANWASQFSEAATTNGPFTNHDESSSATPFMHHLLGAFYANADACQAVDIPYYGDKLSMLVIMPDAGTFDSFLSSLTPTVLSDITNNLEAKEINLALPKFTFSRDVGMGSLLRSLGMTDAFDPIVADFSGIDGGRDLSISDVFHKAFISVDEHGTEAAAATAVVIGGTSIPVADVSLTIDHPFVFFIRERQTGLILFLGKVVSL